MCSKSVPSQTPQTRRPATVTTASEKIPEVHKSGIHGITRAASITNMQNTSGTAFALASSWNTINAIICLLTLILNVNGASGCGRSVDLFRWSCTQGYTPGKHFLPDMIHLHCVRRVSEMVFMNCNTSRHIACHKRHCDAVGAKITGTLLNLAFITLWDARLRMFLVYITSLLIIKKIK